MNPIGKAERCNKMLTAVSISYLKVMPFQASWANAMFGLLPFAAFSVKDSADRSR